MSSVSDVGDRLLVSPAASWSSVQRVAAAAVVLVAAAVPLASHLLSPTFHSTENLVAWAAREPGAAELMKTLDVLAVPFLFATALVYVLLARRRSAKLAWSGGILLGVGLVGLAVVEGFETLALQLAGDPRADQAALVAAVDQMNSPAALLALALLVVGGLIGTVVIAVALWRSGAVPRVVALAIPLPLLVDVVVNEGVGVGPHWIPHVVAMLVAAGVAVAVLTAGKSARP